MDPTDFSVQRPLVVNRQLTIDSCAVSATVNANYNWTRFSISVKPGAQLELRNFHLSNSKIMPQVCIFVRVRARACVCVWVGDCM